MSSVLEIKTLDRETLKVIFELIAKDNDKEKE
jgi:hypothetical protein